MEKDGFREHAEMYNYGINKMFVAQCTQCKEEKAKTYPEKLTAWKVRHRKKCRR